MKPTSDYCQAYQEMIHEAKPFISTKKDKLVSVKEYETDVPTDSNVISKHYVDSKHKQKYTNSTTNSSWKKADVVRKILNKNYASMKTEAIEGKQINIFVDKKQVETDATSKEPEEAKNKFAKAHPEIEISRIDVEWQNPTAATFFKGEATEVKPTSLKKLLERSMSYCKYENTLDDFIACHSELKDWDDNGWDSEETIAAVKDMSKYEYDSAVEMAKMCKSYIDLVEKLIEVRTSTPASDEDTELDMEDDENPTEKDNEDHPLFDPHPGQR